ncbi:hypothetical protein DFH11DRAFT_1878596 [Phellopilus nigrolimitatus]|nr:hypothetical protein DFH11DRAFT_1878596 [Phellopilus nigrolimitatus]
MAVIFLVTVLGRILLTGKYKWQGEKMATAGELRRRFCVRTRWRHCLFYAWERLRVSARYRLASFEGTLVAFYTFQGVFLHEIDTGPLLRMTHIGTWCLCVFQQSMPS